MKKTIDLTYKEISDDQKGTHLFSISTQTVKKAIKELEEEYFQDRNIFRNDDASSDYLFRWEICGLLKLLIWLQATDVFDRKKAAKSGVSAISIEKIIDSYDSITKADTLKDYERILLEASVQAQESKETLEYIQKAYQAMSRFFLLATITYHLYPHDIFKVMEREFDTLTSNLNCNIYANLMLQQRGLSHFKMTKHGTISANGIIPLTLNLKKNLVDTIDRIAVEIYDFDENGVCRRKAVISKDPSLQEQYETICGKHIDSEDYLYREMNEDEISRFGGIETVRRELDSFMGTYFSGKYHLDASASYSDDKTNQTLRNPLKQYIEAFCWMNLLCSGNITMDQWGYTESPSTCYQNSLRARTFLATYHHSGFSFGSYLSHLEEKTRKRYSTVDTLANTETLFQLADQEVDHYLADVQDFKSKSKERMAELDTLINGKKEVNDNVHNIRMQSEALLKNMLAIILKLESKDEVQELLEKYYGAMDDGDHIAYGATN